MKILLLHSSSDEYGASKILLGTVRLLNREGHTTLVILSEPGPLVASLEAAGAKVIIEKLGILRRKYLTPGGMINRFLTIRRASQQIQSLIRIENISLVFSNTTGVLAGALAARSCGIRHIWHLHEIIEHPMLFKKMIGWFLRRYADDIIAVSAAVKNSWKEVVPEEKITVIHNGIDYSPYLEQTSHLREELSLPPSTLVIGMAGRVHFWKGQSYFISIAAILHRHNPELRFLLVGDAFPGYEYLYEEMKQQIQSLGLSEVVQWLGYRRDMPAFMQTIDLLVLPSQLPDPFPTVILEAMASGKPVIATHFGGAVEMIAPGITGDLIPPDQPEKAASIIGNWLESNRLQQAGAAARTRVLAHFSLAAWEQKMLSVIA